MTYRKSSVVKYVDFLMQTTNFIRMKEMQCECYLGNIFDNELSYNKDNCEISEIATNLLNLYQQNLHMCSKKVKALLMIE